MPDKKKSFVEQYHDQKRNVKGKKKSFLMGGLIFLDDILKISKFSCALDSFGVSCTFLSDYHCFKDNPVFTCYRYFETARKRNNFYEKIMEKVISNVSIKKPFSPHIFKNGNKVEKVIDGWVIYNDECSKFIYDLGYKKYRIDKNDK
jgi:hypothetical protein